MVTARENPQLISSVNNQRRISTVSYLPDINGPTSTTNTRERKVSRSVLEIYDADKRRKPKRFYRPCVSLDAMQHTYVLGRSYQELKALSDIDKVQEREKERLHFLVKQCKTNVLREHHKHVRQKVRRFHQSVESFKKEQGFQNSAPAKCKQYNWAIKVY